MLSAVNQHDLDIIQKAIEDCYSLLERDDAALCEIRKHIYALITGFVQDERNTVN